MASPYTLGDCFALLDKRWNEPCIGACDCARHIAGIQSYGSYLMGSCPCCGRVCYIHDYRWNEMSERMEREFQTIRAQINLLGMEYALAMIGVGIE